MMYEINDSELALSQCKPYDELHETYCHVSVDKMTWPYDDPIGYIVIQHSRSSKRISKVIEIVKK
jgi:hypothetical protein